MPRDVICPYSFETHSSLRNIECVIVGRWRRSVRTLAQSVATFISLFLAISVSAQTPTDFCGHWRQQTNSGTQNIGSQNSATQRQLEIEQNGQSLLVKTMVTNSQGTRRLEVKYVIGGPETSYKGLDDDEFRTSVRWDGSTLVFDTVERESGREIPEKTVWTLLGDRNTLQVARQSAKSAGTTPSLTTYVRQVETAGRSQ
jgi:hypothetical protein